MASNFLAGLEAGANVAQRAIEVRRTRQDRKRQQESYDELKGKYGAAAAGNPETVIALEGERRTAGNAQRTQEQEAGLALVRGLKNLPVTGDTPEEQTASRLANFDRVAGLMGRSAQIPEMVQLREAYGQRPEVLDAVAAAFSNPTLLLRQQEIANDTTNATTRQGELGLRQTMAPQTLAVQNTRAGIAQGNLDQRVAENDPTNVFSVAAAREEGKGAGALTQNLPAIRESFSNVITRADQLLSSKDLGSILGMPTLAGISVGGLGSLGPPLPGTPAATAAARLRALASEVRLQAFESLRGAGQITEAESLFGAEAQANLERAQSPEALVSEIRQLQSRMRSRLAALESSAAPTANPRRSPSAAAPSPASPARPSLQSLMDKYK